MKVGAEEIGTNEGSELDEKVEPIEGAIELIMVEASVGKFVDGSLVREFDGMIDGNSEWYFVGNELGLEEGGGNDR